jgi:hypothetical protein
MSGQQSDHFNAINTDNAINTSNTGKDLLALPVLRETLRLREVGRDGH